MAVFYSIIKVVVVVIVDILNFYDHPGKKKKISEVTRSIFMVLSVVPGELVPNWPEFYLVGPFLIANKLLTS